MMNTKEINLSSLEYLNVYCSNRSSSLGYKSGAFLISWDVLAISSEKYGYLRKACYMSVEIFEHHCSQEFN